MSAKHRLEEEITLLLSSFQSIFFSIGESTVLSELDRKIGYYDKAEASRIFSSYQPLVQEMLSEIGKYRRVSQGEVLDVDSFDIKRLVNDVVSRHPSLNGECLERIALKILYWRYLR